MLNVLGVDGATLVISGLFVGIMTNLVLVGGGIHLLVDVVAHVGDGLRGGSEALSERTEAGMAIYAVI